MLPSVRLGLSDGSGELCGRLRVTSKVTRDWPQTSLLGRVNETCRHRNVNPDGPVLSVAGFLRRVPLSL